jgi:sugar (pentulose or hexulose) kinase
VADLARAMVESVAWDLLRCLEAMAGREPAGPEVSRLVAAGAGSSVEVWLDVLSGITGLPVLCRRSGQAASAGAALLAARALGIPLELDRIDPIEREIGPRPTSVGRYRSDRTRIDQVADSVVGLEPPPPTGPAEESPCA